MLFIHVFFLHWPCSKHNKIVKASSLPDFVMLGPKQSWSWERTSTEAAHKISFHSALNQTFPAVLKVVHFPQGSIVALSLSGLQIALSQAASQPHKLPGQQSVGGGFNDWQPVAEAQTWSNKQTNDTTVSLLSSFLKHFVTLLLEIIGNNSRDNKFRMIQFLILNRLYHNFLVLYGFLFKTVTFLQGNINITDSNWIYQLYGVSITDMTMPSYTQTLKCKMSLNYISYYSTLLKESFGYM